MREIARQACGTRRPSGSDSRAENNDRRPERGSVRRSPPALLCAVMPLLRPRRGRPPSRRAGLLLAAGLFTSALSARADPQPSLPMRLGVYVPIAIGIARPCAWTPLDIAVTWDGHQLDGIGREIVEVKLLKRAVYLPGYPQPGPRYLVRTKAPGDKGATNDEQWTFSGTDTVVLNADPILWCAKSLADLKRMRGEKP